MNKNKLIQKQKNQKKENNNKRDKKLNKKSKQLKDNRFQVSQYDPKFISPNQKMTKVKIDKRFADKLQSAKFKITGTVDKYGRYNQQKSGMDEMNDYYYAEDDQVKLSNHDRNKKGSKLVKKIKQADQNQNSLDESHSQNGQQKMQNNISKWMKQYNEQSSDGMDDNIQDFVDQSEGIWSDDDQNIIKGEDVQPTRRLALCNYDWMNISSKDLMLLFSSFKPTAGTVMSVAVYYSQIGKEKMKQQELYGPQGIWNDKADQQYQAKKQSKNSKYNKTTFGFNKNQQEAFDPKKLRAYQKQRLKYCFAIIQCNSKKTADQIYKQCDGNQFQNSNLLFDLRFVPDSLNLDQSMLKQKCDQLPMSGQVKNFISRALGHSKVSLTWEDPELNNIASLKKKNWNKISDKQLDNIDWGIYINQQNQQANDNFNKLIVQNKDSEEQNSKHQNVSDWRRQCNKKYRNQKQDQLQITFPSGFEKPFIKNQEKLSLNKQIKSRKQRWQSNKDQKKRKQQIELLVENNNDKQQFHYNPEDQRFKAVFNNPMYSINPVDPKFDHKRSGQVFAEVVKRNKKKNLL